MWDSLQDWIGDWRHVALLTALVVLAYTARLPARRLIRAICLLLAHGLRHMHRWIGIGAQDALACHDRLLAANLEHEGKRSYASSGTRLAFALVLTLAVGIAGWLNFALLERPMTEILGDSYRVMGVPLYRLAAAAIIVLEVAVGMVLLEALGGTTMFPALERLEDKRGLRLTVIVTLATSLFVLAGIEAALALTRDEISRLERELMGALAGAAPSPTAETVSQISRYAQAAFGFVIPFALAFLGFAIEMLIRNGRIVLQMAVAQFLLALGFVVRLLGHLAQGVMALGLALYDFVIFLPLFIERLVRHRQT